MLPNTAQLERTLQLEIPTGVFNRISSSLLEVVPPSFHVEDNAKYKPEDILKCLMLMCSTQASHEGVSQRLLDIIDKKKVPTGSSLIERIGGSTEEETLTACCKMIDVTTKELLGHGMFDKAVITATDEHDIPTHMKDFNDLYMARGKPKKGTSKMFRYTTTHVVGGSISHTLVASPSGSAYAKADIVRYQLEHAREMGITSRLHLMDKGFYEADVINVMKDMEQPFLMPAVRNSWVMDAVEKYDAGTGKASLRHTVKGTNSSADVKLVIIKKEDVDPDAPLKDRYLPFITNVNRRTVRNLMHEIPEQYKKRWGIETGYRVIEEVRPKTTSRNMCSRMMLFYASVVMYNVWSLSNWFASGRTTGGVKYVRPPITMYRMKDSFRRILEMMIAGFVSSDMFFAEGIT